MEKLLEYKIMPRIMMLVMTLMIEIQALVQ